RPVALVSNDHRDGYHQHRIHQGRASYLPNTLGGGCPAVGDGAYTHYQEKVEGTVIRRRSKSFGDHYGQATLFWNSMSMPEREHIVAAFRFELNKVGHRPIRQAVVDQLNHVDHELAGSVARGVGVVPPAQPVGPNHGRSSPALSQLGAPASSIATRKVAFLVADGVDGVGTRRVIDGMTVLGAVCDFVGLAPDKARAANGHDLIVDHPLETTASVLYDAVVVPCGPSSVEALAASGDAVHFVAEAFKHRKPVAAFGTGVDFLAQASIVDVEVASQDAPVVSDRGVVTTVEAGEELSDVFVSAVIATLAAHRAWDRETAAVPA
ncbi:MAG: DJ-1/PfpI family protein, partial [Kutzneria sp.]|nr:DJ-1/PfpI family protein [Kutzneria sp.]